ncbi:MAG: hypothetical protein J2P16_14420, partial [Mycobacterium sp.]|nr:hypothetical protein [Mycobacterium sp.]
PAEQHAQPDHGVTGPAATVPRMSVWLRVGELLAIEFPMNSFDEVVEAVHGWMRQRAVICWRTDSGPVNAAVLTNFGVETDVLIATADLEPDESSQRGRRLIVRAAISRSPEGTWGEWDVRDLGDDDDGS